MPHLRLRSDQESRALAAVWVPAGALVKDEFSQQSASLEHALAVRAMYGRYRAHGLVRDRQHGLSVRGTGALPPVLSQTRGQQAVVVFGEPASHRQRRFGNFTSGHKLAEAHPVPSRPPNERPFRSQVRRLRGAANELGVFAFCSDLWGPIAVSAGASQQQSFGRSREYFSRASCCRADVC